VAQFLPLTIGLGIHRWAPVGSEKIAGPLGAIANLLLLAVIALIVTKEYAMLATIQLRGWLGMLLLLAISLGIGWVCGGPGRRTRKAFAMTAGAHNAAVALVIVSGNFADTPAVTSVIAYALVSILGCLGIALAMGALPPEQDVTPST
jgi:predicted Na+-dependent transporter